MTWATIHLALWLLPAVVGSAFRGGPLRSVGTILLPRSSAFPIVRIWPNTADEKRANR